MSSRSPDVDAHVDATDALRELIMAGEEFRHEVAAYLKMGVTETMALSYLYSYGPLGQTELAGRLGINSSSVTSLVDRMEAKGVVARSPHPEDRRRSNVELTARGSSLLTQTRTRFERALDEVSLDLETLAIELRTVAAGLRSQTARLALLSPLDDSQPRRQDRPPTQPEGHGAVTEPLEV